MIFVYDTCILPLLNTFLRTEATEEELASSDECCGERGQQTQQDQNDVMIPLKSVMWDNAADDDDDDDQTLETVLTDDDYDTNSISSASETTTTTFCCSASMSRTSISTGSSSSSCCGIMSTLEIRESEALDTLYEHMETIFKVLQNEGVTDSSIFELKLQLFSHNDIMLALEHTQEYIMALCSIQSSKEDGDNQDNREKSDNCILLIALLEEAWIDGLIFFSLQHKASYQQLQAQKYLNMFSPSYVSSQEIQQSQKQVCVKAEQVTQCQTELIKLKSKY